MKKGGISLTILCIMVAALILASCGETTPSIPTTPTTPSTPTSPTSPTTPTTPATPSTPGADTVKVKLTKLDGITIEKAMERPNYGGLLIMSQTVDPVHFDEAFSYVHSCPTLKLTNESLLIGDWTKGPTGTNEASWVYHWFPPRNLSAGALAESWEVPNDQTVIFHIRKGVKWHNKPPVNGREMTADDILYSLKRVWEVPTSYTTAAYPWKTHIESMTAPDKYTFIIKCFPGKTGAVYEMATMHQRIIPHEVVEKYGNLGDWRNACGTGAFLLVDYVSGSSVTFKKNPDYWMKDPFFPENQLPYLEGVKWLIIPDVSTKMAAMRTGKIDWLEPGTTWEDAASLIKTNPELKYFRYDSSTAPVIYWRVDKPELPFYDVRVRRALWMAVDKQAIAKNFYGGNAKILTYPVGDLPEFSDMFIPPEKLPSPAKDLFDFAPDKAKQMLAEAGYPNGFKTEIICYTNQVDLLSIVKDYWAKVGVELRLDVREYATYRSIGIGKTHKELYMYVMNGTLPFRFQHAEKGRTDNYSMTDDPKLMAAYEIIRNAYFDEAKRRQALKDILPYWLGQAYELQLPCPYYYSFWQPWLKGYNGEYSVGYAQHLDFPKWVWLDQELKAKMTGSK